MHTTLWEERGSTAAGLLTSSAIRELLKVTEQPDMISFAGGLPAPEYFPAEEIGLAVERVLAREAGRVLQYGPTNGFPPLRELVMAMMTKRGLALSPNQLIVTSGSQQSLDILGKLLIDPGDLVLVEDPTYVGALQAWRPYQPRYIGLPMDEQGLRTDLLKEILEKLVRNNERPKFLYTVANFQNPTGVTLSTARRTALLDLAEQYGVPIIEDDPYGELRYSGEPVPALAALDAARHGEPRHVVYLSTFSKLLAPGLRVGWAAGPRTLLHRMEQVKEGLDLHTGSLAQAIAYEACRDGLLDRHIPHLRAVYRERRDAMLAALERRMPPGVRWTHPEGGMFLWITLPEGRESREIFHQAVEHKVAFVPGEAFHANGGGANTMRLNFSFSSPERIDDGITRLASVMAAL